MLFFSEHVGDQLGFDYTNWQSFTIIIYSTIKNHIYAFNYVDESHKQGQPHNNSGKDMVL